MKPIRYQYQMTPEELMALVPHLTRKQAKERIALSLRVRQERIQSGCCPHCGCKGHTEAECKLKVQGERELLSVLPSKVKVTPHPVTSSVARAVPATKKPLKIHREAVLR